MVARQLLCFACCSGAVLLHAAVDHYAAICERFPELGLSPTASPAVTVVASPAELQSAITTATSTAGDDLILLDGRTAQTWTGTSPITISGDASNGNLIIVSQNPDTGAFTQPVTFSGFGIAVSRDNSATIFLANVAITESRSPTLTAKTGGLSAMGSGAIKGSCLSITNCGTTNTFSDCRAGGVYIQGPNITLYNSTIASTQAGKDASWAAYGAVTNIANTTVSLIHCTLANNTGTTYGSVTTTNCLITPSFMPITTPTTAVPHCVPDKTAAAVDGATTTTTIRYDTLGNPRTVGVAADLGAVELQAAVTVEPPQDLVALPSGPREVYLGWSVIERARNYQLERSTDGFAWTDITAQTLWRPPRDTTNPEGTIVGWTSARYLAATPGETAQYRLSFAVEGVANRIVAEPQSVTSPALTDVPSLHSRPSAKQVIYLDFTGYVDDFAGNVMAARASLNNNDLTYVQTAPFEYIGYHNNDWNQPYPTANAITDIWRMVAEDFAAFDVDVTTEAPTYDALVKSSEADMNYGKRVVIGYAQGTSTPWYPGGGAFSGGGTFGFEHDRPVYIFSVQSRQNIAAQATHEVSHTLGLAHDSGRIYLPTAFIQDANGTWNTVYDYFSPETQSYYQGVEITPNGVLNKTNHAQTNITWYPIMGAAPTVKDAYDYYYDDYDFMNQWNNGTYSSATNQEDDFAILLGLQEGSGTAFTETPRYSAATRNITLAEDEAGDTPATARSLGTLQAAQPQSTTGVIGKHLTSNTVTNDVDVFSLTTTARGNLTVHVKPNFQGLTEGSSLDAMVEVLDHDGNRMGGATEPLWPDNETYFNDLREATCTVLLPTAGTYYVRVAGTVHPVSSTTLSPDGSASESNPWHFNATDNTGSIGPYTLTTTFEAAPLPTLPKPFVGDTTAYTDAAILKILAATQGEVPARIITNADTPPTAATVSDAIGCFDNVLHYDATNRTLTVAYLLKVNAIQPVGDAMAITLQADGATAPLRFNNAITLSIYNPKTDTLTDLPTTTSPTFDTHHQRLTVHIPTQNLPTMFRIRIRPTQP